MVFFVFSRDAPGSEALRADDDLLEEHWSYMDGFADAMIARGPTLAPDRQTPTGSLHVLDLPSPAAAIEFAELEPNNRAGVYGEHRIWAFQDLLGRTMWEFTGEADEPRFLVIAHSGHDQEHASLGAPGAVSGTRSGAVRTADPVRRADGARGWGSMIGVALALQAPVRDAVEELLADEAAPVGAFPGVEVHDWEFGGRR